MTHLLTGYLNTILGNSSGAEAKPNRYCLYQLKCGSYGVAKIFINTQRRLQFLIEA